MKRSRVFSQEAPGKGDEATSGPSITDLLGHILIINILSRLSVKTISTCRCVCKTWLNLLLDPCFAKLHFTKSQICPLLRNLRDKSFLRTLHLVELDPNETCPIGEGSFDLEKCKIRTKFTLPKIGSARVTDIVNSCNGLICFKGDPIVIYNPLAGQCITLPNPKKDNDTKNVIVCGLGFGVEANQYKVLRVVSQKTWDLTKGKHLSSRVTEIYTIGSGSWRRIENYLYSLRWASPPTFLNGALHWFCDDFQADNFIVSFCFDNEQFQAIPSYNGMVSNGKDSMISMGVLRGCLCICDASGDESIDIWVMNDYGTKESWSKVFEIDTFECTWPRGLCQPIGLLNNQDLCMYHAENALIAYHGEDFRYFKIWDVESKFQAIAYIPSFVSLKDAIGDVDVLDVRSRSGKIQFWKDTSEALYLVEEDKDMISYTNSSSDFDDDDSEEDKDMILSSNSLSDFDEDDSDN